MMKKIFFVDWEVFPFSVMVCLGSTREDIFRQIKKSKYHLDDDEKEHLVMRGGGKTVMLKGGGTIIWLRHYPKKGSGVLVHEITHAVQFLLDRVGIKVGENCDELPAYMTEYLNNKIVEKI